MLDTNNSISYAAPAANSSKVIQVEKLEHADDLAEVQQIKMLDESAMAQTLKSDQEKSFSEAIDRLITDLKQFEIRSKMNQEVLQQDNLMADLRAYQDQSEAVKTVDAIA